MIGLTGGGANDPQRASLAALIAVEGAIFAIGAALVRVATRRHVLPRAEGLLLGAAAGALFGVSAVAIKWLTQAEPGPLLGVLNALIVSGSSVFSAGLPGRVDDTQGSDLEIVDHQSLDRRPRDREPTDGHGAERGRPSARAPIAVGPRRPGPRASTAVARTGIAVNQRVPGARSEREPARSRSGRPDPSVGGSGVR